MADKIDVTGLKEINKILSKLPERIERNVLNSGVRAGAQVIRKEAIAKAGVGKKDIVVRKSRSQKGTSKYRIGPSAKKWYLKFREFGTSPHLIKSKKKILASGEEVYGKAIAHPGQRAKPFLRPALDQGKNEAIRKMAEQIGKRLDKEIVKLKGR